MDYADIPYIAPASRIIYVSGETISGKAGKNITLDLNKTIVDFFNQYLKDTPTKWYDNIIEKYDTKFLIK